MFKPVRQKTRLAREDSLMLLGLGIQIHRISRSRMLCIWDIEIKQTQFKCTQYNSFSFYKSQFLYVMNKNVDQSEGFTLLGLGYDQQLGDQKFRTRRHARNQDKQDKQEGKQEYTR